ncbi:uncharacterized protein LOC108034561 [Drosophila biarmipes]|uniref:uncharacterized protein LOC108034561 n=1 Tax=Drosophila biarmipes TaxID=125945 RepID=UPI0007E857B0|nr:uncharacterized protein LOC108034561 [Drosophila biarmipes]
MASIEPSEELLDRHFRQQVAIYKDVDEARAFQSDRLIMARWMKVFERAPPSQKLARNSLVLLMHGHMKDFGFLKEPFTDVRNCSRNLNEILDVYKGHSCKKVFSQSNSKIGTSTKSTKNIPVTQPKEQKRIGEGKSSSSSRSVSLKKTFTHIPRSKKLEPIREVSEPSEKEPTTNSRASIVTIIETAKTRSISSQTSSSSQKTCPECVTKVERPSVKERVQVLEEGLSKDEEHPFSKSSMEKIRKYYQKWSSYSGDSASNRESEKPPSCSPTAQERLQRITNVIEQVTRRSSAVKNLKDCFEEMAERLRNTSEPEYTVPEGSKAKIPPKNIRSSQDHDSPALMARQTGGQSLPPVFFKNKPVQALLARREKLRVQCLEFYNLDGSLKDGKDMPVPPVDTKRTDLRVKGFLVGAYKALERLKRWRGKPNRLKLFQTCFRGCGLEGFGRLQALDRRFEQVALKWYRKKVVECQQNTWRRYRRNIKQKACHTQEDLRQTHHQLELREELLREGMVHLAKMRELCKTNCSGVVRPEDLRKMLGCLTNEYDKLAEGLKIVVLQKEQLFQ